MTVNVRASCWLVQLWVFWPAKFWNWKVRIESLLWSWRYGIGGRNETNTPSSTPQVQIKSVRQPAEFYAVRVKKKKNCMLVWTLQTLKRKVQFAWSSLLMMEAECSVDTVGWCRSYCEEEACLKTTDDIVNRVYRSWFWKEKQPNPEEERAFLLVNGNDAWFVCDLHRKTLR